MADRKNQPEYVVGNEDQRKPSEKITEEIAACQLEIQLRKDERQGIEAVIRNLSKRVATLKDNLITLLNKDN